MHLHLLTAVDILVHGLYAELPLVTDLDWIEHKHRSSRLTAILLRCAERNTVLHIVQALKHKREIFALISEHGESLELNLHALLHLFTQRSQFLSAVIIFVQRCYHLINLLTL